jgi:hypothetical protein
MAKPHNLFSPIVALPHILSLRKDENDLSEQTLVTGSVNRITKIRLILGVKVFMSVTQRLLERNRDIFKPIKEFNSPSGYIWSPGD